MRHYSQNNKFNYRGATAITRWHPVSNFSVRGLREKWVKTKNGAMKKSQKTINLIEFIISKKTLYFNVFWGIGYSQEQQNQYFNLYCYIRNMVCNSWKNNNNNNLTYYLLSVTKKSTRYVCACVCARMYTRARACVSCFFL